MSSLLFAVIFSTIGLKSEHAREVIVDSIEQNLIHDEVNYILLTRSSYKFGRTTYIFLFDDCYRLFKVSHNSLKQYRNGCVWPINSLIFLENDRITPICVDSSKFNIKKVIGDTITNCNVFIGHEPCYYLKINFEEINFDRSESYRALLNTPYMESFLSNLERDLLNAEQDYKNWFNINLKELHRK